MSTCSLVSASKLHPVPVLAADSVAAEEGGVRQHVTAGAVPLLTFQRLPAFS